MSIVQYCYETFENKFSKIKKELKKILNEAKIKIQKENINNFYLGFSLYNKAEDHYNVFYSASIYANENNKYTVSENDFSGFVFNRVSDKKTKGIKKHQYLKFFFNDIKEELFEKECSYLIYPTTIENKESSETFLIQFYIIYPKTVYPSLNQKIQEIIENTLKSNENTFQCIAYSNPEIIFKKGISKLQNQIVLILDLVRTQNRLSDIYVNLDAVLTSKLIYELKDIAGGVNFKTINHTGDGFVFLYRGEFENIDNDIQLLIERIELSLNKLKDFLEGLENIASSYKVKAVVSKCKILFEMDYINSIDKKLYFSSYLDKIFEHITTHLKQVENQCINDSNVLFLIKDYKNLNNLSTKDFRVCTHKSPSISSEKDVIIIGVSQEKNDEI